MSTEKNQDLSKLSNDEAKDLLKSLCEKLDNLEIREDEVSKNMEAQQSRGTVSCVKFDTKSVRLDPKLKNFNLLK